MKKVKGLGLEVNTKVLREDYTVGFELFIYDTPEHMSQGISKHNRHFGPDDSNEYGGMCINNREFKEYDHDDGKSYLIYGLMFLNLVDISYQVIAHESVHMGIMYMNKCLRYDGPYGLDVDYTGCDKEELLAYCIDEYVDKIIKICKANKIKLS